MAQLYKRTFNPTFDKQKSGAIPLIYQIGTPDYTNKTFMNSILCHLGTGFSMSSNFKTRAKIVKTFSKTLNPGDTLDFTMINHCGPGVRFDIAKSYLFFGGKQPSSYGIIVEATGTQCEGVRYVDNVVFQGTSPGYYNYEYNKKIVVVKHSSLVGDVGSLGASLKKKYAIKAYEQEHLQERPFNVSASVIGNKGDKGVVFGVLSVSAEKPVYSQNTTQPTERTPNIKNEGIEDIKELKGYLKEELNDEINELPDLNEISEEDIEW